METTNYTQEDLVAFNQINIENISFAKHNEFARMKSAKIMIAGVLATLVEGYEGVDFCIEDDLIHSKIPFDEFSKQDNKSFCKACVYASMSFTNLFKLLQTVPSKDILTKYLEKSATIKDESALFEEKNKDEHDFDLINKVLQS